MTDFTAGAVGADQVRECRLDLGIAADQRVVFGIADFGSVERVVQVIVMCDLPCQTHQFVGGFCFGHQTLPRMVTTRSAR